MPCNRASFLELFSAHRSDWDLSFFWLATRYKAWDTILANVGLQPILVAVATGLALTIHLAINFGQDWEYMKVPLCLIISYFNWIRQHSHLGTTATRATRYHLTHLDVTQYCSLSGHALQKCGIGSNVIPSPRTLGEICSLCSCSSQARMSPDPVEIANHKPQSYLTLLPKFPKFVLSSMPTSCLLP